MFNVTFKQLHLPLVLQDLCPGLCLHRLAVPDDELVSKPGCNPSYHQAAPVRSSTPGVANIGPKPLSAQLLEDKMG